MSGDRIDPWIEAYRSGDQTLQRLGLILDRIPSVRLILRRIERESRDEFSREQAEEALRLLETSDAG